MEIVKDHFEQKIKVLERKVVSLESKLMKMSDHQETYSRRNNPRIFCLPEEENEVTGEVVVIICRDKLEIPIAISDIISAPPSRQP